MEKRNVALSLATAQEFYNSGNSALKEIALTAFTEKKLKEKSFKDIKTFKDACDVLGIPLSPLSTILQMMKSHMYQYSKASVAAFKLNIIRQALNQGQEMKLTKGNIWYPYTPFVTKKNTYFNDEFKKGSIKKVTKFKVNKEEYLLLGGRAYYGGYAGLGCFNSLDGVGYSHAVVGLLGCASKEIAEHMSIYFAKEIFEAKYGDFVSYKWV